MSSDIRAVGKSFSTNSTHVWLLLLLFVVFTMVFFLVFLCLINLFFFGAWRRQDICFWTVIMTLYFICKVATDKDPFHKLVIFFLIVYISQKPIPSITRMSAVEWHIYNYLNIIYKFTFKLFYLMICFEIIYFEFPCVAGAHFPKISGSFSQKVGGSFSQSRWLIFPKSVAHFPKVCRWFSRSLWLIFPKPVADFPAVGGWFSRSRWLIFPKSVAHFPKPVADVH